MPTPGARRPKIGIPQEVAAINSEIRKFLDQRDDSGQPIGSCSNGVYAFFDYEEEPIYVGQTKESLRQRIGRHLTNQRTDAVAMSVLDPFEVAYIEVWPFRSLTDAGTDEINSTLNSAEYTVFQHVLRNSVLRAVLNEKEIAPADEVELPESFRGRIVPDEVFVKRNHPDIRIARRASTIAKLAQVISERDVSIGLRRTLHTQARRLESLANQRFKEFREAGVINAREAPGEETGESAG